MNIHKIKIEEHLNTGNDDTRDSIRDSEHNER
jgi:hypothetical protein